MVIKMNFKLTEHAIKRYWERFHYMEDISKKALSNEIFNDLKQYVIIKEINLNKYFIKGNVGYYI
jgi:hypothetical protein